jgi:hypothetical protein
MRTKAGQKYQLNSLEEYQLVKTMVANILICWRPRQDSNLRPSA